MVALNTAARKSPRHLVFLGSSLMLVLVMFALVTAWNDQVSGQVMPPLPPELPPAQPLGPYAADFLLRAGGELDGPSGTGTGAGSLAAGSSITTASTTFAGWRGTLTMTDLLLFAAYKSYLSTRKVFGQAGDGAAYYWYGPDAQGYYFNVRWFDTYEEGGTYAFECSPGPVGAPRYWAGWRSSSPIIRCDNWLVGEGGWSGSVAGMNYLWSQFRGMDSINPSTPTQQDANKWVRGEINGGRWASEVKPLLDTVIRQAVTSADLQTLGITGNPPFNSPPQVLRIAVDAGHGPPGCSGTIGPTYGDLERDVVLNITRQVAADFLARGHTVIATRPPQCVSPESTSSLAERARFAIREGAHVFVSIHNNAAAGSVTNPFGGASYDPAPHGTEAWYDPRWGEASTRSHDLATLVVQEQVGLGLETHGVGATSEPGIKLASNKKPRDGGPLVVLSVATNEGHLPAVLDEAAFLTNTAGNPSDESRLHDPAFQRRVANAIENAIKRFFP